MPDYDRRGFLPYPTIQGIFLKAIKHVGRPYSAAITNIDIENTGPAAAIVHVKVRMRYESPQPLHGDALIAPVLRFDLNVVQPEPHAPFDVSLVVHRTFLRGEDKVFDREISDTTQSGIAHAVGEILERWGQETLTY